MATHTTTLVQEMAPTVDTFGEDDFQDEEKAYLLQEPRLEECANPHGLSYKFWLSAAINTVSTIAIVYI